MDALRLDGRIAVVTGAGRGLGRAAALALAEAGANLVLLARSADQLSNVTQVIEQIGKKAISIAIDISDETAVTAAAQATLREFGRVDILVNNAGMVQVTPVLDTPLDDFRRLLDVNVTGVFLCSKVFGATMVAQRFGRIINIASVAGLGGEANVAGYCASKGAVIALTRALAVEWARHGVTVNALAPGYFSTDLNAKARSDAEVAARLLKNIPLRRFGEPEELGPLVVYLASEAAAFMTGAVLVIDGGQTAR